MIGRSEGAVRWLIQEGMLKATKSGPSRTSKYQISQEALDTFIQEHASKVIEAKEETKEREEPTLTELRKFIELKKISDVAKELDFHVETLRRAIRNHELTAVRIGKEYRVSDTALEDWMRRKAKIAEEVE
jgi:excisionase family DNA binding protein